MNIKLIVYNQHSLIQCVARACVLAIELTNQLSIAMRRKRMKENPYEWNKREICTKTKIDSAVFFHLFSPPSLSICLSPFLFLKSNQWVLLVACLSLLFFYYFVILNLNIMSLWSMNLTIHVTLIVDFFLVC